jgi:hypothetical protein
VKIAQAQLLPVARTLSAAAAASPAPVTADQGPLAAVGGAPELSCEQRRLITSGFVTGLSAGPSGAAGEIADAVDAFAHPPRGPLGAAGYTVGLTVSLVVERSGQLRGRPLQEWLGKAGWTATELVGSLMRHDTDVAETVVAFFSLINDGLDTRAELGAQRAKDAGARSAEDTRTEAWLTTLVDAVRADPHALDSVISSGSPPLSRKGSLPRSMGRHRLARHWGTTAGGRDRAARRSGARAAARVVRRRGRRTVRSRPHAGPRQRG